MQLQIKSQAHLSSQNIGRFIFHFRPIIGNSFRLLCCEILNSRTTPTHIEQCNQFYAIKFIQSQSNFGNEIVSDNDPDSSYLFGKKMSSYLLH